MKHSEEEKAMWLEDWRQSGKLSILTYLNIVIDMSIHCRLCYILTCSISCSRECKNGYDL